MVTRARGRSTLSPAMPRWHNGPMKLRTSLLIGFAAGYVLGSKAGRERYEQIRKMARTVADNPPIRQVIDEAKELTDAGTAKARGVVSDQLRETGEVIREKVG